jgi:hypothetical protein
MQVEDHDNLSQSGHPLPSIPEREASAAVPDRPLRGGATSAHLGKIQSALLGSFHPALTGVYVIRTSLPKKVFDDAATVRSYKSLAFVERAFRCIKTVDLHIRPVYHRFATPNPVRRTVPFAPSTRM